MPSCSTKAAGGKQQMHSILFHYQEMQKIILIQNPDLLIIDTATAPYTTFIISSVATLVFIL